MVYQRVFIPLKVFYVIVFTIKTLKIFLGLISFNILANLIKNKTHFKIKKMKKYLLFCLSVLTIGSVSAQESEPEEENKYRRSSMTMVLVENPGLGEYKDQIVKAYNENPFPDKYNEHKINDQRCDVSELVLSDSDKIASGFLTDTLKTPISLLKAVASLKNLRYLNADSTVAVVEPNKKQEFQAQLEKYLRQKDIAKQVVSTWFNRGADGKMDWNLVKERGMYSASAEDMEQSETQADPTSFLLDFGLLGNTFVVFNKMNFYPNEPVAALIRDEAKRVAAEKLAAAPKALLEKAMAKIDTLYEKTKVGYTVKCNTFLYQLNWDEEVATNFKNYFFNNNIDAKAAWDTTSIMKLNFVGKTTTGSIVTFKIGETRTQEEIINLQVQRTMDNALAKLQKKNVVFRPIAPLSWNTEGKVQAKIGMKEGLEGGEKFEVLERGKNELGLPVYKSIGKVKVDKKIPVWDNRRGAEPLKDEEGNPVEMSSITTFKGKAKGMPGTLFVRQAK